MALEKKKIPEMRRNDETLQTDGSGKSYRKETKIPNSWMRLRKYATRKIRIFRSRVFSRMILLTGALRCLPKVYTSPRHSMQTTIGWQQVLRRMSSSQTSPKTSNPQSFCTSRFHATRLRTRLSPRGRQAFVQGSWFQRVI
jgi:hypothetical protein